jgi:hypothetical protein
VRHRLRIAPQGARIDVAPLPAEITHNVGMSVKDYMGITTGILAF